MTTATIATALVWGAIAGYLAIRTLDNLLALCFCLHGLLIGRWRRLATKATTGRVNPGIIRRLMLRLALYVTLFSFLLKLGYDFTRQKLWFDYGGDGALLFAVVAGIIALCRLPAARRRLAVVWRMSHEFDYAEKRQRTLQLRR